MLELRQLRYFLMVAEELHFGRAAQRLHMTQPPLSQAIQALEQELETELFSRTTRQIRLTAAGKLLQQQARQICQQSEQLKPLLLQASKGETGLLRLDFVSIADYSILPETLLNFHQHYPSVQIELREATSDLQWRALEHQECDAGILLAPIPERLQASLAYRALRHEKLMLALPANWSQEFSSDSLKALAHESLLIFPRKVAPALYDLIMQEFDRLGLRPKLGQQAIQMQTIISLVAAGMGYALVPESVANLRRPGVIYRPLADSQAGIELGIAWRRDDTNPVLANFLSLLQSQSL